jgi:hypothetical protein
MGLIQKNDGVLGVMATATTAAAPNLNLILSHDLNIALPVRQDRSALDRHGASTIAVS